MADEPTRPRTNQEILASLADLDPQDRDAFDAIMACVNPRLTASLIHDYWHDADRAERTPWAVAYLHIGQLVGTIERLLDRLARRDQVH